MTESTLYKLAAFADGEGGGNPAGVWIGDELPAGDVMQAIAHEVGFSETAFVAPATGAKRTVRYFSPAAEVSFCGHATIATGVVLGRNEGNGTYLLSTAIGDVPVTVDDDDGRYRASLVSVEPTYEPASADLVRAAIATLGWRPADLDENLPPAKAYAGAWHLVLAVAGADVLATLDYDFDTLKALMQRENLTTLQLVWQERADLFHSRNPFPVGGVVEDPATGAAAAALGGYLRDAGLLRPPAQFVIRQGTAMGRPSAILVDVPERGGIVVSGSAADI